MTYERYQNGVQPTNGSQSPREIQADVAEIREEMSKTLEEITSKISPKEVLSRWMSAVANDGGTRLLKSLSSSIERHPIPAALIAGGVGYLIFEELQSRKGEGTTRAGEFPEAFEGPRGAQLAHRAREGVQQVAHRASSIASQASETTRNLAHKGQALLQEQPLVIAGLGLAFGAALAGAAPLSQRERQLVGQPAGELMDELEQRARQIKDRVGQGVRAAGEAATSAMTEPIDASDERSTPIR